MAIPLSSDVYTEFRRFFVGRRMNDTDTHGFLE